MGLQGRGRGTLVYEMGGEWFRACMLFIERSQGIDTLEFMLCLCSYHAPHAEVLIHLYF